MSTLEALLLWVVQGVTEFLPISSSGQRAIRTSEQRLSIAIAIGTVPAVIAGGLGSGFIDEHLGEPWMIAIQLILFGALYSASPTACRSAVSYARRACVTMGFRPATF